MEIWVVLAFFLPFKKCPRHVANTIFLKKGGGGGQI